MTSAPPSPPLTPVKKSPLRKWLRRILYFFAGLLLLTTVFYWVESFRGSYALQKAADAFEADYESLDLRQFLTKRPPDGENFGATPLLDGLMGSDDLRTPDGQQIRKRKESLTNLLAIEFEEDELYGISSHSYRDHWERERDKESGRTPVSYSGPIDWKELRGSLLSRKKYLPPVNEPSDVRAVDKALDQEQALFEELRAASRRRYSVFTPAPADRENLEFTTLTPISLRKGREWNVPGLRALIRVRAMTAAILGRTEEAVELAHVLWKFREACLAEPGLGPYFLTKRLEVYWRACVREITCSPGVNDANLKHLLEQPGEGFSQEEEFLLALRSDAALTHSWWQESIRMAEGTFSKESRVGIDYPTDRNFSGREETIAGWCPAGWLSQNAAFDLKEMHLHCIKPLRTGGFPVLPVAGESAINEEGPWCRYYYIYMKFGAGAQINNLLRAYVFYSTRMSQTLLALGMERYRLKNHRYPQDASALVPDFLTKLPVDIDGLPSRMATSADGSTAVIYSVGWNLTDDWHGKLPVDYDETNYEKSADWAIALPFPPLPMP